MTLKRTAIAIIGLLMALTAVRAGVREYLLVVEVQDSSPTIMWVNDSLRMTVSGDTLRFSDASGRIEHCITDIQRIYYYENITTKSENFSIDSRQSIRLYPDRISMHGYRGKSALLSNLQGQLLKIFECNNDDELIPTINLQPGIYLLSVDGKEALKFRIK